MHCLHPRAPSSHPVNLSLQTTTTTGYMPLQSGYIAGPRRPFEEPAAAHFLSSQRRSKPNRDFTACLWKSYNNSPFGNDDGGEKRKKETTQEQRYVWSCCCRSGELLKEGATRTALRSHSRCQIRTILPVAAIS